MHPALPVKSRLLRCLSFKPENGAHSGSRTRTDDALDIVPLLIGLHEHETGTHGGTRTR